MKKANISKLSSFICIFLVFNLAGCAGFLNWLKNQFEKPSIEFKNAKIRGLDLTELKLQFNFKVKNPNGVGVKITRIQYDLFLDSHKIIEGDEAKDQKIEANSSSPLTLPLDIKFIGSRKLVSSLVSGKNLIDYKIEIKISFDTPIGEITIPLKNQGQLDLKPFKNRAVDQINTIKKLSPF